METAPLLHTACLTLQSREQIAAALRRLRLCRERVQDGSVLLLICDLPDAQAQTLPHDADLVRCVQSGVMSMAARRPGEYLFLVRKRCYDKTLRLWLGESQTPSVRQTLHALLIGEAVPPAEASNFSPASFKEAFDTVLITHASLSALPDTPARMLDQLLRTDANALRGEVHVPYRREEPIFTRLYRAGFSLLPTYFIGADAQDEPLAAIYTAQALNQPPSQDAAADCFFLLPAPPTLGDCFSRTAKDYARRKDRMFLLPIVQLLALFASALTGWPLPAALAIVLAEAHALLHPRQLPCALVRLSFLPRHALIAVNAMLKKRFAESKYLPSFSCGSGACVFFGAALLFLAARSTGALAVLFVISLLWLCAPMLERALLLPARERIPLDEGEQRQLRSLAESAFFALKPDAASPAHLLAACAGCMLGLLEPDEAARRAEGMLGRLSSVSAFDCACILTAAQFFKERMADCDAALRELPMKLDTLAEKTLVGEDSLLAALLRIAREDTPQKRALPMLRDAKRSPAMDAIFLPRDRIGESEPLLPLTHPHTFLKRQRLLPPQPAAAEKSDPPSPIGEANRFLILACAALHAPFHALLLRSVRVAPYAPLLDMA